MFFYGVRMLILDNGVLYIQIYEYFKNEIINGTYKAHSKLQAREILQKSIISL